MPMFRWENFTTANGRIYTNNGVPGQLTTYMLIDTLAKLRLMSVNVTGFMRTAHGRRFVQLRVHASRVSPTRRCCLWHWTSVRATYGPEPWAD